MRAEDQNEAKFSLHRPTQLFSPEAAEPNNPEKKDKSVKTTLAARLGSFKLVFDSFVLLSKCLLEN